MSSEEHVVLVTETNHVLGTAPKATVHTDHTPLHRAFSVFIFNPAGQLLIQQRSARKITWPLVWSNSCCGHPALHETVEAAIRRRVPLELGLTELLNLREVLPHFRYRAERDGIVENELCPVWFAETVQEPTPNPNEVADYRWVTWEELRKSVQKNPNNYSDWCRLELEALKR